MKFWYCWTWWKLPVDFSVVGHVPPHAGFSMQGTALHAKIRRFGGLIMCIKKRKHPSPGFVVNIELVGAKFFFPRVVLLMEELQESFLQLP